MKKIVSFILVMLIICGVVLTGCSKKETTNKNNDEKESVVKDYSAFNFTESAWVRDGAHDQETIRFRADGSFSYFCSCGNPVNDSDLCEGYSYDDDSKTITLDCIETTDEMVTEIKIVKCEGNELQLNFNGEILTFYKE